MQEAMTVATIVPALTPNPEELAALRKAARYLERAGTASASQLIGQLPLGDDALLGLTLRDNLLTGAALCRGLLDLFGAA